MYKKFGEDWTYSSRDRQMDGQTDTGVTILHCPTGGEIIRNFSVLQTPKTEDYSSPISDLKQQCSFFHFLFAE